MKRFALWTTMTLIALGLTFAGCQGEEETADRDGDRKTPPADTPATEVAAVPGELPLPEVHSDVIDEEHADLARQSINEGVRYLLGRQNDDGGWGFAPGQSHPALTGLALVALVEHSGLDADTPAIARGYEKLLSYRQDDGGIYVPGQPNTNYNHAVAVMALSKVRPKYDEQLEQAVRFLKGLQIKPGTETPDGDEITEDHPYVGGFSYGKHGRPDLSNAGFSIEAMHQAGVKGDDPAMQRALGFVTRLQNRTEGAENRTFVVRGTDDGGFIYGVTRKEGEFVGESKANEVETQPPHRSYGSMTYTGFKSMLYADVDKDDPRVQAAYEWIRKYWRLDSNPNMPDRRSHQGLYYYYMVFGRALEAWGQDIIEDTRGVEHNWRHELIDTLAERQREDGSWVNEKADRWREGNTVLATSYSLIALNQVLKD
jgi:squalene-hopene/tetraprenyl-beta-curcumene cyclase